jgi:hypothetical protein
MELDSEQVKQIYPYIYTSSDKIKVALLDVIGVKGDKSALSVAQEMSNHENADVVSAANVAVRRLNGRFSG